MLGIDLRGKRALVAGVADDGGLGWAIAKALAEAGASVCVATWPPALGIFETLLRRGKLAESAKFETGDGTLAFERVYPLDADYDKDEDLPTELRENKRYKELGDVSIGGLVERMVADFGERPVDIRRRRLPAGDGDANRSAALPGGAAHPRLAARLDLRKQRVRLFVVREAEEHLVQLDVV